MSNSLWSSEVAIGVASMDASHKALLDKLTQLQNSSNADFPACYASLVARIEDDFRLEEELMERIDYPGLREHREQHARLLGGLHHAAPAIMNGDIDKGRRTIELLPQWFVFHISTADAALGLAVQFRQSDHEAMPDASAAL